MEQLKNTSTVVYLLLIHLENNDLNDTTTAPVVMTMPCHREINDATSTKKLWIHVGGEYLNTPTLLIRGMNHRSEHMLSSFA